MKSSVLKGFDAYSKPLLGRLHPQVMADAWRRFDEYCQLHGPFAKADAPHQLRRIYPTLALFKALTAAGWSRTQARELLWGFFSARAAWFARLLRFVMKIPGLYRKVPAFAVKATLKGFGPDAGFDPVVLERGPEAMAIDMMACPYHRICTEEDASELTGIFCDLDDLCYGTMHPKLAWLRTKTLGRGDDRCDFRIEVKE